MPLEINQSLFSGIFFLILKIYLKNRNVINTKEITILNKMLNNVLSEFNKLYSIFDLTLYDFKISIRALEQEKIFEAILIFTSPKLPQIGLCS